MGICCWFLNYSPWGRELFFINRKEIEWSNFVGFVWMLVKKKKDQKHQLGRYKIVNLVFASAEIVFFLFANN